MCLSSPLGLLTSALALTLAAQLAACTPSIGDKCAISTDCSSRGDRLCDTSQPDGYCTQFNCAKNSCPDEAVCVLFNPNIQGCGYDDRAGGYGSRVARAFCIASCGQNSDCRPGYFCADPRSEPWKGFVQDDVQDKRTCLVIPTEGTAISSQPPLADAAPPPVCSATGPKVDPIEAGPAGDAGASDAGDAADGD